MKEFDGKVAVVTGSGTGIGRELARQLVAEGCGVAACDIIEENLTETLSLCQAEAARGAVVTVHRCDVANEEEVQRFREEVEEQVENQRRAWRRRGVEGVDLDDDQIRNAVQQNLTAFRETAPLTPAQAATIILDGVREDRWRILVGKDAAAIDRAVRKAPERTYDPDFGKLVQAEWGQRD